MKHIKAYRAFESAGQDPFETLKDMMVSWVFDDAEIDRDDWSIEKGYLSGQRKMVVKIDHSKYRKAFSTIAVDVARAVKEETGLSLRMEYASMPESLKIYLENRVTTLDLADAIGAELKTVERNHMPTLTALLDREMCGKAAEWLRGQCRYNIGGYPYEVLEAYDFMAKKLGGQPTVELEIEKFLKDEQFSQRVAFGFPELADKPALYLDSNHVDSPYVWIRISNTSWSITPLRKYMAINFG